MIQVFILINDLARKKMRLQYKRVQTVLSCVSTRASKAEANNNVRHTNLAKNKIMPRRSPRRPPPLLRHNIQTTEQSLQPYLADSPSSGPDEPGRVTYDRYDLGIRYLVAVAHTADSAGDDGALSFRACIPDYVLCAHIAEGGRGLPPRLSHVGGAKRMPCPSRRGERLIFQVKAGIFVTHMDDPFLATLHFPSAMVHAAVRGCAESDCILFNFGMYRDDTLVGGHANGLVFNVRTKTIERYEPMGSDSPRAIARDEIMKTLFRDGFPDWKYESVLYKRGPQSVTDAYDGLCETYSTMFVLVRLRNLDSTVNEVFEALSKLPPLKLLEYALRLNRSMIRNLNLPTRTGGADDADTTTAADPHLPKSLVAGEGATSLTDVPSLPTLADAVYTNGVDAPPPSPPSARRRGEATSHAPPSSSSPPTLHGADDIVAAVTPRAFRATRRRLFHKLEERRD